MCVELFYTKNHFVNLSIILFLKTISLRENAANYEQVLLNIEIQDTFEEHGPGKFKTSLLYFALCIELCYTKYHFVNLFMILFDVSNMCFLLNANSLQNLIHLSIYLSTILAGFQNPF